MKFCNFLLIFIFLFGFCSQIFADCKNLCCKYIYCIITKEILDDGRCVNVKHGRNCVVLETTSQSKLRYVVNPNYASILDDLVLCEICGGENIELNDITCKAYCCEKEGYVLDRKHRIIHLLSCELMDRYYDANYCFFKKKNYKIFEMKSLEFDYACDECFAEIKRFK